MATKCFLSRSPASLAPLCSGDSRSPEPGAKLELIFVGGLVPRKACDLALRAALLRFCEVIWPALLWSAMVRSGTASSSWQDLLESRRAVFFCGWLSHAEVLKRLRSADVFVFPSVRDNGAGVVFEALATGAVPVVADFGGPGDIVHPEVGYKVPLTNESDIVSQMEKILTDLALRSGTS